jgi:hypothetical protein
LENGRTERGALVFAHALKGAMSTEMNMKAIAKKWQPTAQFCVLLMLCVPVGAQTPNPADDPLQRIKTLGLQFRSGDVPVYFSACCESQAIEAQSALIGSRKFYAQKLGVRVDITGVLLTQEDFDRVTAPRQIAFRSPFVTDQPPTLAAIPLGDQSIVNELYLPRQGQATAATKKLLATAGFNYMEAVNKFMIHLVLHETGHIQAREAGISIGERERGSAGWFAEFLANYFSYTYLRAEQPKIALVFEALNLIPLGPVLHTSLEDYERLSTRLVPQSRPAQHISGWKITCGITKILSGARSAFTMRAAELTSSSKSNRNSQARERQQRTKFH